MARADDKSELMAFRIGVANDGNIIFFEFTNQDDGSVMEVELSFHSAKFFYLQLGEAITKAVTKMAQEK